MISLATVKNHLGVADNSKDAELLVEIELINEAFNNFCNRKFERQVHNASVPIGPLESSVFLPNYPIVNVTKFEINNIPQSYIIGNEGELIADSSRFNRGMAAITYEAGYDEADLPKLIKSVFLTIIKQRYEKMLNNEEFENVDGISQISITGVATVKYKDNQNESLDSILDGYQDVLERYRVIGL